LPVVSISLGRILAALLAVGLLLVAAGPAAAMPPTRDGPNAVAQGRPGGGGGGGGLGKPTRGFDISYPQCGGAYPSNPAFGIVGVNGGRVFSVNPCLASQITWGGRAATELYANTGNPGPAMSSFWPAGQTSPRFCDPANTDTADCAYDYGWNAAKHSFETALQAYASLGISTSPAATAWWLDVETSNSWRSNVALNVAALQGGVDYLRTVAGVTKLGFYSTTVQWREITGGTKVFSAYPSWGAGAPNEKAARQHCVSTPGFTGGRLAMVQYIWSGFDANVRC
jgi:hypothetical protein